MKRYVIGAILGAALGLQAGCADMPGTQKDNQMREQGDN